MAFAAPTRTRRELLPQASADRAYIADFACLVSKLVIEIDGSQHGEQSIREEMRSEADGYRVLRFWNNDVLTNIEGVLTVIQNVVLTTPIP